MTTLRWGSALHVGQVRQVNQDQVLTQEGLFAVADGMGGHRAGEVASEVAVDTLRRDFSEPSSEALVAAIQQANANVVSLARGDADLRGMGTTVSVLALLRDGDRQLLGVVNVGDSRCYLLRAESEELEQITEDHSLVATLVRQGQLTESEAASHPQRNILTRALGIDGTVLVDSWELEPVQGDRYLLCSDGLFNEVDDRTIAAVLRRLADPDEAASELVRLANEHGGRDNISVVVVDVVDAETSLGAAPGRDARIVGVVHGEDRAGAGPEAIPARPDPVGRSGAPGAGATATSTAISTATTADAPTTATEAAPAAKGPTSRFSWRVVAFVLALAAIVGGTYYAVDWLAGNSWYVGLQGEEVAIFQGRPDGTLWIDPSLEEVPEPPIAAADLPAEFADDVADGREFSSLDEARQYVDNIREAMADDAPDGDDAGGDIGGAVTTTSSTTTSVVGGAGVPPPSPAPSLP